MRVINKFSEESPGMGRDDDASRYIYRVETLRSGDCVYLQRPAALYYGFDFVVCVENANYAEPGRRRRNSPKHTDIRSDLLFKRKKNPAMYQRLYVLLRRVYKCHDVSDAEMGSVHFHCGLPVDHVLKVMKWLFIEQDIRYWNYSGRDMTWSIVPKP